MRENKRKLISVLLAFLAIISIGASSYAHPGKTDSSGGHRDNKNKSGLGSYHYHCGGHPAHLHKNGVCPYLSSSSSNKKKSTSSSNSGNKNTSTATVSEKNNTKSVETNENIEVKDIKINESITNLKKGEKQSLTVTIAPNNATDKEVIWQSSDKNIASVDSKGVITAKECGAVWISAISSNGKTSSIKLYVNKILNAENSIETRSNNSKTSHDEESNFLKGVAALGVLGGGTYLGYRQYKKKK
mgnify:FL=1